jgi:hypothetical protein
VGSPPIGTGSSFDITTNPIETELSQLGALRDGHPALSRGWSVVRYAKGGLLAVSRIDPVARKEVLVVLNNTADSASVRVTTATPSTKWSQLHGGPIPFVAPSSDATGSVAVPVNGLNAVVLEADAQIPAAPPRPPKLVLRGDDLTSLWVAEASVPGKAPVSVAFAVYRGGTWQRLAVDTSPPYRAFLDPSRFEKHEQVRLVAIARSLDGRTAVSTVVPFRMRRR